VTDPVNSAAEIDKPQLTFKPKFMHHFIEDELIAGYTDLKLDFYFAPLTMDCYFTYTYKSRSRSSFNIDQLFEEYFKNGFINTRAQFEKVLLEQNSFEIPGRFETQVSRNGVFYNTYLVENLTEPKFFWYLKNIQVFTLFFIENGRLIDKCNEQWKLLFMIEQVRSNKQKKDILTFVGFISYNPMLRQGDKVRLKKDQQIILPCFQKMGLGSHMLFYTL
jgi:hypothetical protein